MAPYPKTASRESLAMHNRTVTQVSLYGKRRGLYYYALLFVLTNCCCLAGTNALFAQNTMIKGFVDVLANYRQDTLSFGLGEQDLFITSELSDRLSFLGESVFKYDQSAHTKFSVSIERVVLKYSLIGNHNVLAGKHHTPVNYWNDTYHHGRLFFPTIERPLVFAVNIFPLHTTGIDFQGHNLGPLKFGYDLMVGNGIGSSEIADNNKYKSVTAAVHIKPLEFFRIGASYYHDVITKGSIVNEKLVDWKVKQHLVTGSVAYFGKKVEVLAESTLGLNHTDSTGNKRTLGSYLYTGYKITEKLVPYLRVDNLNFQNGEVFYTKDNSTSLLGGVRYQINYLAVLKFEYQYLNSDLMGDQHRLAAQFAVGF
jgi:hypothetical protein